MLEKYKWVEDVSIMEAFCVCIAVGANRSVVEAAFKIVPESKKVILAKDQFAFAAEDSAGNSVVQIFDIKNAIITYEDNGWTGDDDTVVQQIAAPLSVSIFRNVNAVSRCTVAKHGKMVRQFDPLLYEADGALAEEAAFKWHLDNPLASAFALAEMLTGVEITQALLLETEHPAYWTGHGN